MVAAILVALSGCGSSGGHSEGEFTVPSESMAPTLHSGDKVELDKDPKSVKRGDIVVFHPPLGAERHVCGATHSAQSVCPRPTPDPAMPLFIKRIVASPRDRIKFIGGAAYVNGRKLREPYAKLDRSCGICNLPEEATVRGDHVFVAGDARGESADSREWGPIRSAWIVGKVTGGK